MSVDEVEPVEAEAAEEDAVAQQGTHLASAQTVTHEYLTQSGKVMRETITTNQTVTAVMDFVYDESGKPFALEYSSNGGRNFVTYYYVLNLQGDVVKLVDENGAEAASYEYDAWGNILSQSGSMAELNPLRYRGYYYDSETGFYYLQSRYYDPATRRFINADVYASTGQSFVGTNMFAYCGNNPMCYSDPGGARYINSGIIYHGNGVSEYTDAGTSCVPSADINYSRSDAINYARTYWQVSNDAFPDYTGHGGDCTNFLSQCVYAGGIQQCDEWQIPRRFGGALIGIFSRNRAWNPTDSWVNAGASFNYVTQNLRLRYVAALRFSDICNYVESGAIQPGDLIYFKRGNEIRHAAIITDIRNGLVYYTQHSDSLCDKALTSMKSYDVIYISRMGD